MGTEFGLIGRSLSHSFSKKYFEDKFNREGLAGFKYSLFEIESVTEIKALIKNSPDLRGLNVTIPYKTDILPLLDEVEDEAKSIQAVNTIKISDGKLKGYNTDYYGFMKSLTSWIPSAGIKALILGSGGSSRAVVAVFHQLGIEYQIVSSSRSDLLSYSDLCDDDRIFEDHRLIVNTTPLGMSPDVKSFADIPYNKISSGHYLYDLVYNPEETEFLKKGKSRGAFTKNGLEMLHLQAEKSWEIWSR